MKELQHFLPLDTSCATGHVNGLRDEVALAGTQSIGQSVRRVNVEISTDHGRPLHEIDEANIAIEFATGKTLQMTTAHGDEAIMLPSPIFPQPKMDDGFASEIRCISESTPWSKFVGATLRDIDVLLVPRRASHIICGFLLTFSNNHQIGFENAGNGQIRLHASPDWDPTNHTIARWLCGQT